MSLFGGIGAGGKSEEAHSIMKEDLAGGKLLLRIVGADAAWWQIMVFAFNVNSAMKRLVLGDSWVNRRLKAIRFRLIGLSGRVLSAEDNCLFDSPGSSVNALIFEARRRMLCLCDSG